MILGVRRIELNDGGRTTTSKDSSLARRLSTYCNLAGKEIMSQMDLSQAEVDTVALSGEDSVNSLNQGVGARMTMEDGTNCNSSNIQRVVVVGNDADTAAESDDEQFVDANDSFLNNILPHSSLEHLPILAEQYREGSNFGTLEQCGRWLMAIPRNDVLALQQTIEYRRFLEAFDKLGEAHRRTVTLEQQHMEREDDDITETMSNFATATASDRSVHHPQTPPNVHESILRLQNEALPFSPSSPSTMPRRRYSFLQHFAVDDVLLRIFEFIECSFLVRTGMTCHRFRELTIRSAEQRTHRLADGRLLRSAMKMLRAQEQIEGVGPREGRGPFVPIPMLGLPRRVKVSGSGDPEYNGIYFCTGSNGNGFLFTKPRIPERRIRVRSSTPSTSQNNAQLLYELDEAGWMEEIPEGGIVDAAMDDVHNGHAIADIDDAVDDGVDGGEHIDVGGNGQRHDAVDVSFGDEPNRSRLLRCVIAKRFSNETILWYMSKEVIDETTHEISQNFSFWAKLLVTGDATPDICQYPSQTSILARNGDPAWQQLTSTLDLDLPIVELLDN